MFMLYYIPIHHGFESREDGMPIFFNVLTIIGVLVAFITNVMWTIKTLKETLVKWKEISLLILFIILTELIEVTLL